MGISTAAKQLQRGTKASNARATATGKGARLADLNRLHSHMQSSIKPGRFLRSKNPAENRASIVLGDGSSDASVGDSWLDDEATEKEFVIDGELISAADYLGKEWTARINTIQSIVPGAKSLSLATELRPHQDVGADKMNHISGQDPHVCILGDEMGLGKTIQTVEACCRAKEQKMVHGCFDVIIAPKLCLSQWLGEMNSKFEGPHKPKAMILDNPSVTANELLSGGYDFVITTYQFVMARHRAFKKNAQFHEVAQMLGLDETISKVGPRAIPDLNAKCTNALYSTLYHELGLPFRHIILDEGHVAKKEGGQIHEAIRALYAERLFILSGTFVPNRWWDLRGLFDLFPRPHPFNTPERFNKAFARQSSTGEYVEPSPSKRNRLTKYMMGIVLARPSSVIVLPDLTFTYHDFVVDVDDALISAGWALRFVKLIMYAGKGRKAEQRRIKALAAAMRARQYVAGRFLVNERARTAEDQLKDQGLRQLNDYLASLGAENEEQLMSITQLTPDMTMELVEFMEKSVRIKKPKQKETEEGANEEPSEGGHKAHSQEDSEIKDPSFEPENASHVEGKIKADDGDGNGDGDGDEDDDGEDEDDEDDEDDADNDDDYDLADEAKSTQAKPDRKAWLAKLSAATDFEISTPKVRAVMDLIEHIQEVYAGEKTIVFSISLMFHDVLEALIERENPNISVLRLDGRCKSIEAAQVIRDAFAAAMSNTILLVTAGSSAYGINLQMASKIIQAEPWWNINEERQAYSRCHRSGQKLECHVWVIRGINSVIDFMIQNTRNKKADVNMKIVGPLRREDSEAPDIPVQFAGGVGERSRRI